MSRANAKTRAKNDNYPTPMALCREIVKRYDAERLRNARILVPMCGEGRFVRALRERADVLGLKRDEEEEGDGSFQATCDDCHGNLCGAAGANCHNANAHARAACEAPLIVGIDVVASYETAALVAGASVFIAGDVLLATGLVGNYDLIIDNPSFTLAEQLVRKMVPLLAPGGELALLLRQGFRGAGRVGPREEHAGAAPLFTDYPLDEINVIDPRPVFGLNKHGKPGTDGAEYELFTWHKRDGDSGKLTSARLIGDPIIWTPDPAEVQALRDASKAAIALGTICPPCTSGNHTECLDTKTKRLAVGPECTCKHESVPTVVETSPAAAQQIVDALGARAEQPAPVLEALDIEL